MGLLKAQVVMRALTGMAEDSVANTLYFLSGSLADPDMPNTAEINEVRDRLIDFYTDVQASGSAIGSFIGEQITRDSNAHSIDFYWNEDDEPAATWGSPIATRSWTLSAVSPGTPFPSEVATVLSFHGDLTDVPQTAPNPTPPPATIRPASRLRGRIYLGPLQNIAGAEDGTTHEIYINTNWRDTLTQAASALLAANDTTWAWCGATKAGEGTFDIVGGWVDNAFDTQRRRGQDATVRTLWS